MRIDYGVILALLPKDFVTLKPVYKHRSANHFFCNLKARLQQKNALDTRKSGMIDMIKNKLRSYGANNGPEEENAVQEILQGTALYAL